MYIICIGLLSILFWKGVSLSYPWLSYFHKLENLQANLENILFFPTGSWEICLVWNKKSAVVDHFLNNLTIELSLCPTGFLSKLLSYNSSKAS